MVVLVELRVVRWPDPPADARRSEGLRSAPLRDSRQGLPRPSHSGRHLLREEHPSRAAPIALTLPAGSAYFEIPSTFTASTFARAAWTLNALRSRARTCASLSV